jgi:hypothetical protein
MAFTAFDLRPAVDNKSATLVAAAGDFVRVRFSERSGTVLVYFHVLANGVETREPINDLFHWPTSALMAGDTVWVSSNNLVPAYEVKGVLELGA